MGYYSEINIFHANAYIDPDKLEKIKSRLEDIAGMRLHYERDGNDEYKLVEIDLDDVYGKFYETDELAAHLSDVLVKGEITMKFIGEDGEMWGYEIRPKEDVEPLQTITIPSSYVSDVMKYIEFLRQNSGGKNEKR